METKTYEFDGVDDVTVTNIQVEDRPKLIDVLKKTSAVIKFTKRDNSERIMTATLAAEQVIPWERKTNRAPREKNDDIQVVFDVDEQEWRSFRWDSVKSFNFVL